MKSIRRLAWILALFVAAANVSSFAFARSLTFAERVQYQRNIEEVYWRHRLWPKENAAPKPVLAAVMSDEAIRDRVEDYLKKSKVLETWWQRSISREQLQEELARMATDSRDPATLRELYSALGNDPFVIAETLARQTLADRLVRELYASDARLHAETRSMAEAALAACNTIECMKSMSGEFHETTWKRARGDRDPAAALARDQTLDLDSREWDEHLERLAVRLDAKPGSLPTGRVSRLEETPEAYVVSGVVSQRKGEITTRDVTWRKRAFDSWWSDRRTETGADVVAEAADYSLAAPLAGGCVDDTWAVRSAAPGPRYYSAAVWTGTEMIVWGGLVGSGTQLNTGGRYNPTTNSWTPTSLGANVPAVRARHTAVWTGTEMIVWGGYNTGGGLNTGGRYNPSTDSWITTSLGANVPAARSDHTTVWTGTEMIVWGGNVLAADNTGGRYNPATDSWAATSMGANVPSARYYHRAVWTGTEMIVWGGYNAGDLDTGGRYNPSTNSWQATSTGANVPSSRSYHTAVWTGAEMIVWGGSHGGGVPNVGGRYDPSNDSWSTTSTGAGVPAGRYFHSAVWTGTEMIVWGGYAGGYSNTGGRYNPVTDSWTPTSIGASVPLGRYLQTAVWTGAEMIVWGGTYNDGIDHYLNTGGRYNPKTDSWTATSTLAAAPEVRRNQAEVWTGAELIVWGGLVGSGTHLNTGGRYNPATDSWTPTSLGANVPAARSRHTAVWTGTEMIVWGGYNAGGGLNTGGRYDPSTDSWITTALGANVPAARSDHTTVWTGTEMIVWGGNTLAADNTGGRYNPATDSWAATSMGANVPSARYYHRAVWTGTEMIVWGGFNVADLNTGGRYNPSTNSWQATSTGANVPSIRSYHTAVWTGASMIVWGGTHAGGVPTSGGRYDPSSDSWSTTSTGAGVPTGRYYHSAVWTGTEMIVWGGIAAVLDFNSGGRYNAATDSWRATSLGASVPRGRSYHSAVWTGTHMFVWGGYAFSGPPAGNELGDYCACAEGVIPEAVTAVSVSKSGVTASFTWSAPVGAATYDVLRGRIRDWPVGSNPGTETCFDDLAGTSTSDATVPDVDEGYWYLVRAENTCGNGSYGSQASHGVPTATRMSATCP
jgi:hypothetical protein